jgi:transposase
MELTEAQYHQIKDCLPCQRGNVSLSNLQVLNAILYIAEHGCKWRGLPFKEAIDYWRGKIKLPSSGWTGIWQEQHSHGFVVAGANHDALLEDIYNAIDKARSTGGYEAFEAAFPEIVKTHG